MTILARYSAFSQDEVDSYAEEVIQLMNELGLPRPLMMLTLCRALTAAANEQELDEAAILLDEMREEPWNYADNNDLDEEVDDDGE